MGFLIGLLLLVLFAKVFLDIGIGLFKLLVGLIVIVALFSLAPIGLMFLGILLPIIIFASIIGVILKIIF